MRSSRYPAPMRQAGCTSENNVLQELKDVRQIPGEMRRRWFSSRDMDLIVWFDHDDRPVSFELCYDKRSSEKALRWSPSGFTHSVVDDGENRPGRYKSTPVLRESGLFEAARVINQLDSECRQLPDEIVRFVMSVIASHPEIATSHKTSSSNRINM